MRTNKTRICANVLLIMVVALMLSCSCNDKPTEPKPEEEKDYPFYMVNTANPGWNSVYYPNVNRVDSFWLPTEKLFKVSADGKYLFAKPKDSTCFAAYLLDSISNCDTLQIDHMLPAFTSIVSVSPDNRFLAVEHNGLSIVRTTDYSVVFHDTSYATRYGNFTSDGNRYYGGELHVDLQGTPEIIRRWSCPFGGLYSFVPSEDETIWYYIVRVFDFQFYFVAYEHETDSVLYSQFMTPGFGEIKRGINSSKVFFTNSGTGFIIIGPYPPPFFHAYDPETNTAVDTIWALNQCPDEVEMNVSDIELTADGKLIVAIAEGMGAILVYDAVTLDYKHCTFISHGWMANDLETQKIP